MHRINYKHLLYFYNVAETGSLHAAANKLAVTSQTISGQLKLLEDDLGEPLLRRKGRNVELTDAGQMAYQYCKDIFRLGDEMQEVLQLGLDARPEELRIGIVDALPKSITHRILAPVIENHPDMKIICREEQMTTLLGELAVHRLDLVLADSPMPPGMNIRCYSHELGSSEIACLAHRRLLSSETFPSCLKDAPILIPTGSSSTLRTNILSWLKRQGINVRVAGEFDDSALLKAFGSAGHGFFFAPEVITEEICNRYDVELVGVVPDLQQSFYAIVAERRHPHSAVREITERAGSYISRLNL